MRRSFKAAAVALLAASALAAAGCGGSSSTTTTSSTPSTPAAVPTQTAQEAGTGFYDMAALATAFEAKYNSQPGPKFDTGSVTCMATGGQTASCMGTIVDDGTSYLSGQQHGQTVQISADGQQYMTGQQ